MEMIVLMREDCVHEDFVRLLGSSETEYDAQVIAMRRSTGDASEHRWRAVTPPFPSGERLQMLMDAAVEKIAKGGGEWMLDLDEKVMTLPEVYKVAAELHLSVGLVAVLRSPDHKPATSAQ